MAETKKSKISAYDEELLKAVKTVYSYKLACEANIVAICYKNSDTLFNYELKLEDFSENAWRVYWQIAYDIVIKEQKPILDEITIGLYLEKHSKLREKYDEYGGYQKIEDAKQYVKSENIDGYIKDLNKWNTVLKLLKLKFPVFDRLSDYADMNVAEIYAEWDAILNHIFINADGDVDSYSLEDGIDQLIEDLDNGMAVGLPYHDMSLLNKETGGQLEGNITLVGGLSNVGKTTFARSITIPSIIENKEKLVIMLNEDSRQKWQREMLIWIANNIYKKELQKYVVRDGKYSEETKSLLKKCADWIKENASNHTITIIPFKRYKTEKAIKIIKKYSSLGVKYFLLDTFKADSGTKANENLSIAMAQAMVDINDIIKPASKNVHILITFQLAKSSARQRYYTQDNTGVAKNIVDVASTTIMIRDLFDDELPNGKNALKVYRLDGKNGKSKIPCTLNPDKHYQIVFIVKNREGSANQYQVVVEHDMSRNIMKEIGITHVMMDFN